MDFAGAIFPARAHLKSLTEAEEEASPRTNRNRNQHETCFDSPGSLASRCGCSPPASFPLSWPVVAGDRSARINARRAELIFISVLQLQVGLPHTISSVSLCFEHVVPMAIELERRLAWGCPSWQASDGSAKVGASCSEQHARSFRDRITVTIIPHQQDPDFLCRLYGHGPASLDKIIWAA